MPRRSKSFASALISACLAMMLAGCSTTRVKPDEPGLNLPGPPDYLNTVKTPMGTPTTPAKELLIQRRHTIEDLNSRIVRARRAWIEMKKDAAHAP